MLGKNVCGKDILEEKLAQIIINFWLEWWFKDFASAIWSRHRLLCFIANIKSANMKNKARKSTTCTLIIIKISKSIIIKLLLILISIPHNHHQDPLIIDCPDQASVIVLVVASLLVTSRQYIGTPTSSSC